MFHTYQIAVKKYIHNILQEKYSAHHTIVERVGYQMATEQDTMDFLKMIASVYETAYMQGIADFQAGLKKQGYNFEAEFKPQS